jgi:tetratricopeptide (TPR) repeat protein
MLNKYNAIFVFIIAICFAVSCSSSDPLIGEAESNIQDGNFDAAMASAEKYIQKSPDNPAGYYWKGVALGQKAQSTQPPSDATPIYEDMSKSFTKAEEMASKMEEKPDEIERISSVRTSMWSAEHNKAVEYASNDSVMKVTESPLDSAIAHLNNATIIEPDSALSWGVLAQVNGMNENFGEAAKAQQKFIGMDKNPEMKSYLLLAQYYRNADQPKEAVTVLENAQQTYPDSTQIVEILADSYSQSGQSDKAISMVEDLVEKDPSNAQYRLSLGTQIYQSALELQSGYDENVDKIFDIQKKMQGASDSEASEMENQVGQLKSENDELLQEINGKTDRAVEQLDAALESTPNNANAYNTLGIIYQNKAAVFFDQRNMTTDNQEAAKLDKQAKAELESAMTNYEKAAEIDSENPKYWRSLFQVYTALGMDKKASEAEQKAGMQ